MWAILHKCKFRSSQIILMGFAGVILAGALLLLLPFATNSGEHASFWDALFTSVSAVCVTGLVVQDTATYWSGFGQVVILLLIQIGGMGVVTIAAAIAMASGKRISLMQRSTMQDAVSAPQVGGIVRFTGFFLKGIFLFELIGALALMPAFVPRYGLKGIWMAIFHSVSAFCNAGFDLMGRVSPGSSLAFYAQDPVVCITVMLLITLGGIGFFVWQDLWSNRTNLKGISVYSRLVLYISAVLVFGGAVLFGAAEWNNPETLGAFTPGGKLLGAMFQSVTTRTAGFASFSQGAMTELGKVLSCIWMLIGGSSGSTAGGMKTVTVAVLLLSTLSVLRGRSRLTVLHRTISQSQISIASTIVTLMVSLSVLGAIVLVALNDISFVDALFETTSALGTVGLTADITATLGALSQIMIIVFMFFGRVGIMTIAMGFLLSDRTEERFRYADTKLMMG